MLDANARTHPSRPGAAALAQPDPTYFDGDCVEVPVLMSSQQAAALEAVARRRGLTAGQLLRRIVGEFTARSL